MVAIIDYGAGNLHSVKNMLDYLGVKSQITGDADTILSADRVILPGVGSFGDAMKNLSDCGLTDVVRRAADGSRPLLGICLGLHMLFESSEESPGVEGLGIFKGKPLQTQKRGVKFAKPIFDSHIKIRAANAALRLYNLYSTNQSADVLSGEA